MFKDLSKKMMLILISLGLIIQPMTVYAASGNTETTKEDEKTSDEESSDESLIDSTLQYKAAIVECSTKEGSENNAYIFKTDAITQEQFKKIKEIAVEVDKTAEDYNADDYISLQLTEVQFDQSNSGNNINKTETITVPVKEYSSLVKDIKKAADSVVADSEFNVDVALLQSKIIAASVTPTPQPTTTPEPADDTPTQDFSEIKVNTQRVSDVLWEPDASRKTKINFILNADEPIKLEYFYTSTASSPVINFVSPDNQIYTNSSDYLGENLKIINRKRQTIIGHPEYVYDILYIYTTDKDVAGKWTMTYQIDEITTETIVLNAQVPDNWENLYIDYKTPVKSIVLIYRDVKKSPLVTSDGGMDIKEICQAEPAPYGSDIKPAEEEEPEEVNPLTKYIGLLIALIVISCLASVYFFWQMSKNKMSKERHNIIKANKKLKVKKKKENASLIKVIDKMDSKYKDDEIEIDPLTYFKDAEEPEYVEPEPESEPEPEPEPKKKDIPIVPAGGYVMPMIPPVMPVMMPIDPNNPNAQPKEYP